LIVDDTSAQRGLVEGVEQVVEHAQEENQQGTTTLPKVLVIQISAKLRAIKENKLKNR
jgi:hypothetical protein